MMVLYLEQISITDSPLVRCLHWFRSLPHQHHMEILHSPFLAFLWYTAWWSRWRSEKVHCGVSVFSQRNSFTINIYMKHGAHGSHPWSLSVIQALQLWYIKREYHCHISIKFASYPHPFSNNMTIVSDDPLWWPFIDSLRFISYFAGLWRAVVCWTSNDQSNLKCGFTVTSCVVVMYDWGEHDNIQGLLILQFFSVLTFGQEVCWCYNRSSHLAKMVL